MLNTKLFYFYIFQKNKKFKNNKIMFNKEV